MARVYRHTQIGTALILVFTVTLLPLAAITVFVEPHPWYIAVLVLLVLIGAVFATLTVTVDAQDLRWHFSFGFWKKRLALSEIADAEPVRNTWWWGLGIRMTPHGWLYNVSGLDAVEITRTDGSTFRIGTDEPEALAAAIRTGIGRTAA